MAILKKQFSSHERGLGDEDWFYLSRDTENGRVFVYHEWSHRKGERYESGNTDVEIDAFLRQRGTASERLRALIGTLVKE